MGNNNILVNKNCFKQINIIGNGSFGKVYRVKDLKYKKDYAMKELSKLKIILKNNIKNVIIESELLSKLNHPFLIKLHFSFQDKENLYFILDYKECSDLRYYYSKEIKFNEQQSKFIISSLILSLEYIHINKIVHRDLKPENVMFDNKGYVYLTDFGIARKLNNNYDIDMDSGGSPGYMAPEILFKQRYTFTVDYFALGIILYELMLASRPYFGNRKNIRKQLNEEEKQISLDEIPQGWSVEACDLINKLILMDPAKRLGNKGLDEIKSHPWFKYYDWKSLYLKKLISPFIPTLTEINLEETLEEDIKEISNYYKNKYNIMLNSADFNSKFDGFLYFNRYANKKNMDKEFENPHQIFEEIDKKEKKFFDELKKKDEKEKLKSSKKKRHKKVWSAEIIENKKKLFFEGNNKDGIIIKNNASEEKDKNMKLIKVNRTNNIKKVNLGNDNDYTQNNNDKKIIEVNRNKKFAN